MADRIMQLNLAVDEGTYYALWYEPQDRRQQITPQIGPPPERGSRSSIIPVETTLFAQSIYMQRADRLRKYYPSIGKHGDRMIRPTGSDALGAHSYVFVGQVVATDRCAMLQNDYEHGDLRRLDEWQLSFVVDCGVPLEFHEHYTPTRDPTLLTLEGQIEDGVYVEGMATLWNGFSGFGLHQSVRGALAGMKVLQMDPSSTQFGRVVDVAFGYRLSIDPDAISPATAFMVLDIEEIGPLAYRPFPARAPDCPEPDYPGMIRLSEDDSVRIVELGPSDAPD